MVISSIAFKVAITALIFLIFVVCIDEMNGTGHPSINSPMWIVVPGALAAITMVVAFVVCAISLVWAL
ncbi:hypothetical protein CNR37_00107 [Pseudomonas phage ventosus]|uniref:Transmembrane protein n=1 Tax=Pseudomonas phage ventosus TaxID=2048980 RepID=A0A2H4P802_9CAUD|nr:hypothetical protein CNR37_00107 [Pseudomonas phage ventosus]